MILSKLPRFSGLLISVVLLIQPALSRADLIYNSQPQPYGGEALGYGGAYTALSNESSGLFYNPAMKPQPDGLSLGLYLRSVYWRVELILPSLEKEFDEDSDFTRLSESAFEWIDEEESKVLEEYGAGGINMHIEWEPDDRGGLFTINLNYGFRYESHEYSIFEFDEFMGQIYDYVDWRLDSPAPS